jgi:hypothetical protein
MNITLSWDLFVIVFIALVITYTLIIGKKESIKIIIASYVAIVAVQGFGNILERLLKESGSILSYAGVAADPVLISTIKLVLFVVIVIALAVKAGFDVNYEKDPNPVVNMVLTILCGVATSGLLLSTLLTYASSAPLLDSSIATTGSLLPIIQQSQLMQILIINQDVFFLLPAVVLLVTGILSNR